jgi:hypothetical protein
MNGLMKGHVMGHVIGGQSYVYVPRKTLSYHGYTEFAIEHKPRGGSTRAARGRRAAQETSR